MGISSRPRSKVTLSKECHAIDELPAGIRVPRGIAMSNAEGIASVKSWWARADVRQIVARGRRPGLGPVPIRSNRPSRTARYSPLRDRPSGAWLILVASLAIRAIMVRIMVRSHSTHAGVADDGVAIGGEAVR